MIDDNVLIKCVRSRGYKTDWPEKVQSLKTRIYQIKLGFPGLNNDHLSIVQYKDIQEGDLFIWDQYLELPYFGDEAPIMFRVLPEEKGVIEGIGIGIDSVRDPDRINLRWMDIVNLPKISENNLVLRVNVRPTLNGGPGYYYFFKAYRDNRI